MLRTQQDLQDALAEQAEDQPASKIAELQQQLDDAKAAHTRQTGALSSNYKFELAKAKCEHTKALKEVIATGQHERAQAVQQLASTHEAIVIDVARVAETLRRLQPDLPDVRQWVPAFQTVLHKAASHRLPRPPGRRTRVWWPSERPTLRRRTG